MSRLMLKSAKRASLIENLRSLRGLGKMRVRGSGSCIANGERGLEKWKLLVSLEAPKALGGFLHGRACPTQSHQSSCWTRTAHSGTNSRSGGGQALGQARELGGAGGIYALQAAIIACHAQARTAGDTDWSHIAGLYAELAAVVRYQSSNSTAWLPSAWPRAQ